MYKHENGIWYTNFSYKGKRYRTSLGTEDQDEAIMLEAQMKSDLKRKLHLKECTWDWDKACENYLISKRENKDIATTEKHLRWLKKHLTGVPLNKIDAQLIGEIADISNATKLRGPRKGQGFRSVETTNHHLRTIRKILRHAVAKGQLDSCPSIKIETVKKKKTRFLSYAEADRLEAILKKRGEKGQHVYDGVRFALSTGLRHGNIAGLEWRNVELDAAQPYCWVDSSASKSNEPIRVPLNPQAVEILRSRKGIHRTHVFTYRGKPTSMNGDGFESARDEAGLSWLRFHDLRHTWASWHAMAGTSLQELQVLGGWQTMDMVLRYAHLATSHTDQAANNVMRRPEQKPQPKLVAVG